MITYGSTTLTSYNTITKIEVYYYQSTSPTTQTGGSWSTTKPTWVDGRYVWQKIRTTYEGKLDNGSYYSESDPVNITGQQGATGTAAYSYKLNSSDSIIGKTKDGEYTIKKITFSATYKQGTGAVSAYGGRFKIESTTNGSTWKTEYTSSGNEASKEFTIPDDIILIKCSLYQSDGTTVLLDIVTVPVVKDGVDAIGLRDSIPYYLASDKDTGITRLTQGWTRYRPQLTAEKKYLWVYYVSRYSEGTTEPELIEIKDDLVHFVNNGDESPVESCVVDIEPVQEGSGDPSPDNVRPITGWTGCEVQRTGKNLLPIPTKTVILSSGVVVSASEGKLQITGTGNSYGTYNIDLPYTIPAGTQMVLNGNTTGNGVVSYRVRNKDDNNYAQINLNTPKSVSFDVNRFQVAVDPNAEYSYAIENIQLEVGSTATDYEPYTGQTYPITFPSEAGTVYGGYVDVINGELVVDRVMDTFDGTEKWNILSSDDKRISMHSLLSHQKMETSTSITQMVSNSIPLRGSSERASNDDNIISCRGTSYLSRFLYIFVPPTMFTTTDALKAYLAQTPLQVVYPIATPLTYPLTPQEITMLCKENNIFADTGQTAISYYNNQTSTDPYVDYSLTSAFDASTTALDKVEEVTQDLVDLQAQIDGKIETWCQSTDPSTAWTTTELKNQHNGDLWYYTGESTSSYKNNTTYKYIASTNKWTEYSASADLFDKIDGKTAIYYGKPSAVTQNLEVGDYLVDSTDGCSYRWDGSKWVKLTDYKTAIDNIEIGGRNLLCNSNQSLTTVSSKGDFYLSETIPADTTIVVSVQIDADDITWASSGNRRMGFEMSQATDGVASGTQYAGIWWAYPKTTFHGRIWSKVKLTRDFPATIKRFGLYVQGVTGGTYKVSKPKVEIATKPTDWSPAPEDVDSSIATAQSTANTAIDRATATYGTCSTAATTPLKEVVCENFILFDGVRIQVAFENANSTNVPSLNVNNTGAKQILINQAIVSESNQLLWAENAQMEFVYDGTYWVLQNAPYSLYGICSVTEEIPEKVIECEEAVICKGTTITVDFMYSNTSDNTVFNVANIAQKPLLVNGDTLKVNSRFNWHAGAIRTFYFDGQAWNMSDDIVSAYIDEYETEQDEDGIMVHPVGQKNTGWSIGSTLELLKNGVSYIKMWFDKVEEGEFSLPFIRIGKESGNHVLVGDDAVTIREDQKELAHYSSLGITFDDETPYKIGNDTTYIAFEDTDNDAKADSLRIVADSISFHSNGTEKDLRSELEGLNENIDLNAQAIEQNAEAIENTQKYIQIDPEVPSIKLATNDRNYLLIESNKLGFWVDANETAYMSQNQMNIPTASITNLLMQTTNAETGETIGQVGWVMRTNGHLSLKIMN